MLIMDDPAGERLNHAMTKFDNDGARSIQAGRDKGNPSLSVTASGSGLGDGHERVGT